METDLFGERGRKRGVGHAGTPGLGPDPETCGTCIHVRVTGLTAKRYYKCGIGRITSGAATDIRLKDPACENWAGED